MRTQMIMAAMACLAMTGSVARAQSTADRAAAEQLFQEGRVLMKSGDFAAACPKLEASFKLDPALGTQLNLALCYEHINRMASAWAHYRGAADRAAQAGQGRRAELARTRAAELEPRVPRLVVHVQAAAQMPGLVVVRNDAALDPALFDKPLYVDAGQHHVRATAPGRQPFVLEVQVTTGEERVVEVPLLAPVSNPVTDKTDDPDTVPAATAAERDQRQSNPGQSTDAGTQTSAGSREPYGMPMGTAPRAGRNPRRMLAWATGGAGVVGLALGLGVGWTANRSAQVLFDADLCNPDTRVCANDEALARLESARTRARVATVVAGSGVVFIATGAVLFWTSRETSEDTRIARIVPMAGPSELGLAVTGRF